MPGQAKCSLMCPSSHRTGGTDPATEQDHQVSLVFLESCDARAGRRGERGGGQHARGCLTTHGLISADPRPAQPCLGPPRPDPAGLPNGADAITNKSTAAQTGSLPPHSPEHCSHSGQAEPPQVSWSRLSRMLPGKSFI